jgi:hypothetical protein
MVALAYMAAVEAAAPRVRKAVAATASDMVEAVLMLVEVVVGPTAAAQVATAVHYSVELAAREAIAAALAA